MRCRFWILALVIGLSALWLPRSSHAGKEQPVRVLLVLGSGPPHDIRKLAPILDKLLADGDAKEVRDDLRRAVVVAAQPDDVEMIGEFSDQR